MDANKKVKELAIAATKAYLTYGQKDLKVNLLNANEPSVMEKFAKEPFSGKIDFKGTKISGYFAVITNKEFLEKTYPDSSAKLDKELLKDWCGEICNIIIGNFKRECASYNINISITPPKSQEALLKPTAANSIEIIFAIDKGYLKVLLQTNFLDNIDFTKMQKSEEVKPDFLIEF